MVLLGGKWNNAMLPWEPLPHHLLSHDTFQLKQTYRVEEFALKRKKKWDNNAVRWKLDFREEMNRPERAGSSHSWLIISGHSPEGVEPWVAPRWALNGVMRIGGKSITVTFPCSASKAPLWAAIELFNLEDKHQGSKGIDSWFILHFKEGKIGLPRSGW